MFFFGWKLFPLHQPRFRKKRRTAGQASIEDNTFGFIWHRFRMFFFGDRIVRIFGGIFLEKTSKLPGEEAT